MCGKTLSYDSARDRYRVAYTFVCVHSVHRVLGERNTVRLYVYYRQLDFSYVKRVNVWCPKFDRRTVSVNNLYFTFDITLFLI